MWFDPHAGDSGALPDAPPDTPGVPADTQPDTPGQVVVGPRLEMTPPTMTTECGANPSLSLLELRNPGDQPLSITGYQLGETQTSDPTGARRGAALADTAVFQLIAPSAFPVVIQPGESVTFDVLPPPTTIGSDRGGTVKSSMLTFETNLDVAPAAIKLEATVVGANLEFPDLDNSNIVFTSASGACPGSRQVTVRNTGNGVAELAELVASGFAFPDFASGPLGGGESMTATIAPVNPQRCRAGQIIEYTVTATSGAVCQPAVLTVTFNTGAASGCSCS